MKQKNNVRRKPRARPALKKEEIPSRFSGREEVFSVHLSEEGDKKNAGKKQKRIRRKRADTILRGTGLKTMQEAAAETARQEAGQEKEGMDSTPQEAVRSAEGAGFFWVSETVNRGRAHQSHFSEEKKSGYENRQIVHIKRNSFHNLTREQGSYAAGPSEKAQRTGKDAQKHLIRKGYQSRQGTANTGPGVDIRRGLRKKAAEETVKGIKQVVKKTGEFFERHPVLLIILLIAGVITLLIGAGISGGTMLVSGTVTPSSLATSYTAEDEDIKDTENDYRSLEADLSSKVTDLETNYPGYSSYELNAGQIGHDPYKLAALLTVLHQNYEREEVQEDLQKIFEMQYSLSMQDEIGSVERKTVRVGESLGNVVTSGYCNCSICCGQWAGGPTASGAYPTANHTIAVDAHSPVVPMGTKVVMNGIEYTVEDTGNFARYGVAFDVYYGDHSTAQQHGHKTWEALIADDNGSQEVEVLVSSGNRQFTAVLQNNGLDYVAEHLLSKDERELYDLLVETKGNKPELFANDIYANGGAGWFDYTIAGEALSDQRFAGMMAEATKYLGYKYVWGGSNPSTSFDCSGFVCWVINHSGNGWNVGRTTADGLCNMLPKVPLSEAKPGDIIFFQGTYATSGASHVGIIVGDGVMIHCGTPIQYARYDSPYFQQHFYCVGRLPN